jgi:hypothetical protein
MTNAGRTQDRTLSGLRAAPRPAPVSSRSVVATMLATSLLAIATIATGAESALDTPTDDGAIVEHLPVHIGDAAQRRAARAAERAQRDALRRHPDELPLALTAARDAIARARLQGDPRELGAAEAALATWWSLRDPPPEVRLLRATVRQSQHDFDAARTDLDALLAAPAAVPLAVRAQAELTRAAIDQVRARYDDALAGCRHLAGPDFAALGGNVQLSALACQAEIASLRGRADLASAALQRLAGADDASNPGATATPAWLTLMRAELAERRGDAQAGALYAQALRARADVYTLCAYADWLLDHERAAEVPALLKGHEAADPVLLRLAIAYRRLHGARDARTVEATRTLGERFDAALLRGDRSHGREQSRYERELHDRPLAALALAQKNWTVQREPADAVALVRAARAAHRPEAAEPVWRLMRETGGRDARLGDVPGASSALAPIVPASAPTPTLTPTLTARSDR